PARTTPSRIIEHTKDIAPDDPLVARFKAMPDHDQVFADAIKRAHVVLGFALRNEEKGKLPRRKASYSNLGDDPRPWVPHFRGAAANLPELEAAATGNAVLDILPERDGIARRAPLITAIGEQLYPALAIDTLRVAQGAPGYIVKSTGASGISSFGEHAGLNAIRVGQIVVPTGEDGTVWMHFTPHQPERFVSAWKILDGTADPELVKDNIVLLGTTAEGLKEFRPTQLDPAEAGVEIHAQLIEQMLLGDIIKRPDWARGAEVIFMLYIGIGLLLLLPRVGARWTALLGLSAVTPAVCASWYAYYWYGLLIDPVFPSLVGVLVYLSSSAVLFFRTETERRQVRHAFSRYLAPAVVEHIAEHACLAALAMRTELARLNDAWRAEATAAGRPFREVRAGIGLNTGECVVGNLGSDQRFDYSVLGDDANLASRLEGQTKTYHVDIILGERTAFQVPQFAMLEIDLILVVGKTKPVRIFFLLGDESVRATSAFATLESAHDSM